MEMKQSDNICEGYREIYFFIKKKYHILYRYTNNIYSVYYSLKVQIVYNILFYQFNWYINSMKFFYTSSIMKYINISTYKF